LTDKAIMKSGNRPPAGEVPSPARPPDKFGRATNLLDGAKSPVRTCWGLPVLRKEGACRKGDEGHHLFQGGE